MKSIKQLVSRSIITSISKKDKEGDNLLLYKVVQSWDDIFSKNLVNKLYATAVQTCGKGKKNLIVTVKNKAESQELYNLKVMMKERINLYLGQEIFEDIIII